MDIVGAIIGIILFSPLFIVIPILIKLDSKGSVFFIQTRCGKGGEALQDHQIPFHDHGCGEIIKGFGTSE